MKQATYRGRLVWYLIIALISAVSLSLINPASVAAQSMDEYFQISYDPASFSQNQINGNQVFYVTIHGKATCIKDLPLAVSETSITSRIVARHIASGTVVILNPTYTVAINPFPSQRGDATEMTQTAPLQFPTQAQSGSYNVTGELVEAKIKVLLVWLDVTKYLPQSQPVGSLEYTASPPALIGGGGGGGGGGTIPQSPTVETNLFGKTSSFKTTDTGKILEKIEATSKDGMLTINVPQDTVALDKDSKSLKRLEATINDKPPAPPQDTSIVGPAYDLGPDGVTFAPPITLTWAYSPETLPQGIDERHLLIAFWNGSQWEALESQVNVDANTVSARISHFTQFALIGKSAPPPLTESLSFSRLSVIPSEVNPTEPVTISAVVINTGSASQSHTVVLEINGLEGARKKVVVDAGSSQKVEFIITRSAAGTYQVSIGGLSGTFTVKAAVPADFAVSDLTITPAEIESGEKVTISVIITNTGALTGSYEAIFKIGDAVIAAQEVTLAGGASQPVSIITTKNEAGTYIVNVNGLSDTFTVKALAINAKPTNWWLVGGIIVGCVIIGMVTWLILRRRKLTQPIS